MGKFQQNMLRTCQSQVDWSSWEVRLEMKYAGNPSITIIQTSHNLRIWRKQLFINNVVIFGSFPLSWHFSFYTFHFAFFLTLSLPLLHCAPVSWHSIPMSDWAFVQLLLLGARWSTHFPFFQQEIDPHRYHPAPSIVTYELLCNFSRWDNRRNIKKLFLYEWFFTMNNE